jgi:hypothetical protein
MPQIVDVPGMGQVEFPDGMSDQDITSAIQKNIGKPQPQASAKDRYLGSWGARTIMGMGAPILAATQMLGGEEGRKFVADLEASKQRGMAAEGKEGFDAYGLMGSLIPGGMIGKGVAAALPTAQSVLARAGVGAAQGAATAAAQPVTTSPDSDFWNDKATQALTGGAVGTVAPVIGGAVKALIGRGPDLTPTKAATLSAGQEAGYVVQPSKVNPSFLTERLESIAGKTAVGQEAAKRNQEITNALAAKALGMPKGTNLTPEVLSDFRAQQGKVYDQIADISPQAKSALNELKQARFESKAQWNYYNRSANPEALTAAKNADGLAEMATDELEREAREAGRSELVKALSDARLKIAKSYDVSRALNPASGEVNAKALGRIFAKRGEKAMTGDLGTVGKMAGAFKDVMREGGNVPSPGVSGTDSGMSALLGIGGGVAAGPAGVLASGLPLLRGPARNLVLSKAYQKFATSDPAKFQAIVDALAQQGSAATGTAVGRAN